MSLRKSKARTLQERRVYQTFQNKYLKNIGYLSLNPKDEKICKVCGRVITWRKKWEKNWDSIQYCSDACRRAKGSLKNGHEETILTLLDGRDFGKTICPSEVLPIEERKDKQKMEKVREAARRLVAEGKIEIVQGGMPVDPSTVKGPIRLRLKN